MTSLTSNAWIEFLEEFRIAKQELGDPEILWFRGHKYYDFYLLPSLLRYHNGPDKEKYLFNGFKKFSHRIFQQRESDWETLFDMQHYGIPTRLLDWTENFGIALFFCAFYNKKFAPDSDGSLYLLNPLKLNQNSGKNHIIRIPDEEDIFPYKGIYWENRPFAPNAPIAIEPNFKNDRMLAQRGMFTVHNDYILPIEDKFPNAIKKLRLNKKAIDSAVDFLDLANINELSVFPDLAGVSDYLVMSANLKTNHL